MILKVNDLEKKTERNKIFLFHGVNDGHKEEIVSPAEGKRRAPGSEQDGKSWKKRFETLQAWYDKTIAALGDDSDKSSTSSVLGKKKNSDRRKEAEKVDFPELPSVPHYAAWLEQVMRPVMDGSGAPLEALLWWAEIS